MPVPALLGGVLAGLLGASSPVLAEIKKRMHNGQEVTEHIDENDSPCGGRGLGGCYSNPGGQHHVWYSAISEPHTISHELSHVDGMRHTQWEPTRTGPFGTLLNCAIVTAPANQYELFDRICVTHRGETREPGLLDVNGNWKGK